ncbi:MAG: high-potential iron-sulfur protein [Burkholderiales bacterium]
MSNTRRVFLMTLAATGAFATTAARSQAQPMVDPTDPQAKALDYVADTTKADKQKHPKHANDQDCANCALYQGKAGSEAGGCPLFAGKQVAAKGWCSAWAKKA